MIQVHYFSFGLQYNVKRCFAKNCVRTSLLDIESLVTWAADEESELSEIEHIILML